MAYSEMKNAPPLYGWVIAVAAGAVATAVSYLLIGIEGNGSVFVGAVITLIVGVIFTIAESPKKEATKAGHVAQVTSAAETPTSNRDKVAHDSEPVIAPATEDAVSGASPSEMSADAPVAGTKPTMLTSAIGAPDDLKRISGVGPVLESKLNELGVYHFWQIARWTPEEVAWVDDAISFKGRIARDGWIAQASTLASTSPAKPPA